MQKLYSCVGNKTEKEKQTVTDGNESVIHVRNTNSRKNHEPQPFPPPSDSQIGSIGRKAAERDSRHGSKELQYF